jgi:prepilin-type processing-associated H-X9-DG protein
MKNDYAAVIPPHFPLRPTSTPEDEYWGDNGTFYGVIAPGIDGWNAGFHKLFPRTRMADILDGTSNTMAIAEKFIPTWAYDDWWFGDDKGAFHGYDEVTFRSTVNNHAYFRNNPTQDFNVPQDGTQDWHAGFVFGSAHPSGINAVFADGSVHHISYNVDSLVFNALGHRADGTVFNNDF